MKFKDIIAEWRKGCSCTQVPLIYPGECVECTDAMLVALQRAFEDAMTLVRSVADGYERQDYNAWAKRIIARRD